MPNTNSQSRLPAMGQKLADKATRDSVAARLADAAVHKSIAGALALIPSDEALLRDVALSLVTTARHHEAHTLYLLQTVPGLGKMRSRVLLYDIHDSARFPSVQVFLSAGRLVTWRQDSAGKRDGTAGTQIGKAHRKWACSDAAVLCLRDHAAAQTSRARLEHKQGQGKALLVLAQQRARAVDDMLQRQGAFATEMFFPREPIREGMSLTPYWTPRG
jgi:hypothetical protein